jgi:hypothetical protein
VSQTLENINAKIDKFSGPRYKAAQEFLNSACKRILNLELDFDHVQGGKQVIYAINNSKGIPLDAMGELCATIALLSPFLKSLVPFLVP